MSKKLKDKVAIVTGGSKGIVDSELRKKVEARTPLGRIGAPEDITKAVIFFASEDSAWITGETLLISGGFR